MGIGVGRAPKKPPSRPVYIKVECKGCGAPDQSVKCKYCGRVL